MSDLRARRHRTTKFEITEAGLRLFEAQGYDTVTMEDIAEAAGVSRRTLYRHFPTKDRILLDLPLESMAQWDQIVDELPADAAPKVVIETAARAIAAWSDADGERIRTAWQIVAKTPALEPGFLANPTWTERVVSVLTDQARGPAFDTRAAVVVAGAYLGAIDATMAHWAAGAEGTIADAIETIIDQLSPVWPAPRRRH